jgi:replicative DNA helicase
MDSVIKDSFRKLESVSESDGFITGIPSGFDDFDGLTAGLQPADLIIIAGRPSMGKTAFALNIGYNAARKTGKGVAVFSLEMSKLHLGLRLLGLTAGINASKLRTGHLTDRDWARLTEAANQLSELPIYIDDTSGMSVLDMKARCRRLTKKTDLCMVIVDYLQLVQGRRSAESRQLEISEISRYLKALAKDIDVPVLALSQLSRAVEWRPRQRPQLSDLRESGTIEQDADMVTFIYREEYYDEQTSKKGQAELIIAKHRNGPTGSVNLQFDRRYALFSNLTRTNQVENRGE